jgi:hypothetical protein
MRPPLPRVGLVVTLAMVSVYGTEADTDSLECASGGFESTRLAAV